jgi:hypothetical protein
MITIKNQYVCKMMQSGQATFNFATDRITTKTPTILSKVGYNKIKNHFVISINKKIKILSLYNNC